MSNSPMPLLEHLHEFRRRIVKSAAAVVAGTILGFFFYNPMITAISKPICDLDATKIQGVQKCGSLYVNGVMGPLNLQFKIAILLGIIFAAPVWIFQLWRFVAPALHKKEKKYTYIFTGVAAPLFVLGIFLGYTILPIVIKVLFGFTPGNLGNLVTFDNYLDFVIRLLLVFGVAFELPIFLMALNLLGVLSGKKMIKPWRIAIFFIFLFAAIATPTGDPFTMSILAAPLTILYFGSCLLALLLDRRKRKKEPHIQQIESSDIERPSSIDDD